MSSTTSCIEEKEIVIVGGGICGLATALALHKKGISSTVLERADSVRTTGAAIGIFTNGWRALGQLGVATQLRNKAIPMKGLRDISLKDGKQQELPLGKEELRCLKRSDLTQILADSLPLSTIRFGCHILAAKLDPLTSQTLLQLQDGTLIKAKVVIGCDGVNSVISELIGLNAIKVFSICGVRGFTSYPSGHGFSSEFVRIRRGNLIFGRMQVDDNLAYWFVGRPWTPSDSRVSKEPELIKRATIESVMDFPTEIVEMINNSDLDSLTLTHLRYRAPWDILLGSFRKGTVTVAGDAMHVMGPFLGQGGSAALEDAVVLARNLAQELCVTGSEGIGQVMPARIGAAMDRYIKERRMRLLMLSTQTYLTGMFLEASSQLTKLVIVIALVVFFGNSFGHARYNCGRL